MVTLRNGDKLRLKCTFQHKGAAFTGAKLYGAIGTKAPEFNEVLYNIVTVSGIKEDADWTTYSVNVDIEIKNVGTIAIPAAAYYEAYVKLIGIPGADIYWYGPDNDINLEVPAEAEFQSLDVSYSKV